MKQYGKVIAMANDPHGTGGGRHAVICISGEIILCRVDVRDTKPDKKQGDYEVRQDSYRSFLDDKQIGIGDQVQIEITKV